MVEDARVRGAMGLAKLCVCIWIGAIAPPTCGGGGPLP